MSRLTALTCLVLALAFVLGCSHARHYRIRHDAESFYAVLHSNVANGDTMARVQQLLGPGQTVDATEKVTVLRKMRVIERAVVGKHPDAYADGVHDDDTFLLYPMGRAAFTYLQFRDGLLVNHVPEDCRGVPELTKLSAE